MKNVLAIVATLLMFAGASSAEARRYEGRSDGYKSSEAREAARERRAARAERTYKKKRAYRTQKTYRTKSASRVTKQRKAYRAKRTYRSYASASYDSSYSAPVRSYRAHGNNGRPRAWCGWWMRQQRGGGPELNLAWNWSRWGRPSGPQVGAVVVWRHHVGEIVGRAANGQWLVRSGNDGGAVRTRARSVAGAVFRMG